MTSELSYSVAGGTEMHGGGRVIGIRILVAGVEQNVRESDPVSSVIYEAVQKIKDEMLAYELSLDPTELTAAKSERVDLLMCFPAGTPIFVEEIPNGYWGNAYHARLRPWFIVTTPIGRFKIGFRKRVINIDWSDTVGTRSSEYLFPDENVTKGDKYIHAWSLKDAWRYIDKIFKNQHAESNG